VNNISLAINFSWSLLLPNPNSHFFINVILFLLVVLSILLINILLFLIYKNRNDVLKSKWQKIINILIQTTIFNEADDQQIIISDGIGKHLKDKAFRVVLIEELVRARKNFSGLAGKNLQSVYRQLQLDNDSLKKLDSNSWHIKAHAIQELSIMGQEDALDKIYGLTNNKNEQVRMEAQNGVVLLSGFEGLKFLDFLSYPISKWQQIKLITELGDAGSVPSSYIKRWLRSNNNSVVIFSLRLVALSHYFELQHQVIDCLSHSASLVRLSAILTLKEIYTGETASKLLDIYYEEELQNKLAILEVLQDIATEEEIPFLLQQLENENNQLRLAAGRAIASIGNGVETLDTFQFANEHPWNIIIRQIKGEHTA
jgi:hypothetical protein